MWLIVIIVQVPNKVFFLLSQLMIISQCATKDQQLVDVLFDWSTTLFLNAVFNTPFFKILKRNISKNVYHFTAKLCRIFPLKCTYLIFINVK